MFIIPRVLDRLVITAIIILLFQHRNLLLLLLMFKPFSSSLLFIGHEVGAKIWLMCAESSQWSLWLLASKTETGKHKTEA